MNNTLVFPRASLEIDRNGEWHWLCNSEALKDDEMRDWFFKQAGAHCYTYVRVSRILVEVADDRLAVWDHDLLLYDIGAMVPVVATVGGSLKDWAAYYGLPEQSQTRQNRFLITSVDLYKPLDVAQYGYKLPQSLAESFFPEFKHLTYRR